MKDRFIVASVALEAAARPSVAAHRQHAMHVAPKTGLRHAVRPPPSRCGHAEERAGRPAQQLGTAVRSQLGSLFKCGSAVPELIGGVAAHLLAGGAGFDFMKSQIDCVAAQLVTRLFDGAAKNLADFGWRFDRVHLFAPVDGSNNRASCAKYKPLIKNFSTDWFASAPSLEML